MEIPSCSCGYPEGDILDEIRDDYRCSKIGERCNDCGYWFDGKEYVNHVQYGHVHGDECSCDECEEITVNELEAEYPADEIEYNLYACDSCAHDRLLMNQLGMCSQTEILKYGWLLSDVLEYLSEYATDDTRRYVFWKILLPLKRRMKKNNFKERI